MRANRPIVITSSPVTSAASGLGLPESQAPSSGSNTFRVIENHVSMVADDESVPHQPPGNPAMPGNVSPVYSYSNYDQSSGSADENAV